MEFYYFEVDKDFVKKPFPKKTSKRFVEKRFLNPLTNSSFTRFHFHEIDDEFFHLVVYKKEEKEALLNCFYDGIEQVFFFEKEEKWLTEMQNTLLWKHLSMLEPSSSTLHLYNKKDILAMLE